MVKKVEIIIITSKETTVQTVTKLSVVTAVEEVTVANKSVMEFNHADKQTKERTDVRHDQFYMHFVQETHKLRHQNHRKSV
jgi:hypothetical protein